MNRSSGAWSTAEDPASQRRIAAAKVETPGEQQFREAAKAVAAMEPWRREEIRRELGIKK